MGSRNKTYGYNCCIVTVEPDSVGWENVVKFLLQGWQGRVVPGSFTQTDLLDYVMDEQATETVAQPIWQVP